MSIEEKVLNRDEWLKIALARYDERAGRVRERYWKRMGSNSRAEKNQDAFLAQLDALLKSETFQKIKSYYVSSPDATNEAALMSLLAADCCIGSLEYLLCEKLEELPDGYADDNKRV